MSHDISPIEHFLDQVKQHPIIWSVVSVGLFTTGLLGRPALDHAISSSQQPNEFGVFTTQLDSKIHASDVRDLAPKHSAIMANRYYSKENMIVLNKDWRALDNHLEKCQIQPAQCSASFQAVVKALNIIKRIPEPLAKAAAVRYVVGAAIAYDRESLANNSLHHRHSIDAIDQGLGVCDEMAKTNVAFLRYTGTKESDVGFVTLEVVQGNKQQPDGNIKTDYSGHAVALVRIHNTNYVLDASDIDISADVSREYVRNFLADNSKITRSNVYAQPDLSRETPTMNDIYPVSIANSLGITDYKVLGRGSNYQPRIAPTTLPNVPATATALLITDKTLRAEFIEAVTDILTARNAAIEKNNPLPPQPVSPVDKTTAKQTARPLPRGWF